MTLKDINRGAQKNLAGPKHGKLTLLQSNSDSSDDDFALERSQSLSVRNENSFDSAFLKSQFKPPPESPVQPNLSFDNSTFLKDDGPIDNGSNEFEPSFYSSILKSSTALLSPLKGGDDSVRFEHMDRSAYTSGDGGDDGEFSIGRLMLMKSQRDVKADEIDTSGQFHSVSKDDTAVYPKKTVDFEPSLPLSVNHIYSSQISNDFGGGGGKEKFSLWNVFATEMAETLDWRSPAKHRTNPSVPTFENQLVKIVGKHADQIPSGALDETSKILRKSNRSISPLKHLRLQDGSLLDVQNSLREASTASGFSAIASLESSEHLPSLYASPSYFGRSLQNLTELR